VTFTKSSWPTTIVFAILQLNVSYLNDSNKKAVLPNDFHVTYTLLLIYNRQFARRGLKNSANEIDNCYDLNDRAYFVQSADFN
jgi:hypothetical protein